MRIREFIESLPTGLREKASACRNAKELVAFADAEKIDLPDEVLGDIAGGEGAYSLFPSGGNDSTPLLCPGCGSTNIGVCVLPDYDYLCNDCGKMFN